MRPEGLGKFKNSPHWVHLCNFFCVCFSDADLHSLLNNMSQQQLMQLFGGVGQMGGLSSLLESGHIRLRYKTVILQPRVLSVYGVSLHEQQVWCQ
jgi:hypothetical protein